MRGGGGRLRISLWPLMAGACLLFSPLTVSAQDLDQGKSPAQLFAGSCNACHKTPQGLGTGRSVGTLTGFLRQHYTTSASSAAALAAYVASAGPAPASRAASKPHPSHSAERPQPPAAVGRDERIPVRNLPSSGTEHQAKPAEGRPAPRAGAVMPRRPNTVPSVESDPAPIAISHEPIALPPEPPKAAHAATADEKPNVAVAPAHGSAEGAAASAAAQPSQSGFASPLP